MMCRLGDGRRGSAAPGFTGEGTGHQNEPGEGSSCRRSSTRSTSGSVRSSPRRTSCTSTSSSRPSSRTGLAAQAQANTLENFAYGFDKTFEGAVIDRQTGNEDLFRRLMDDNEFCGLVKSYLRRRVYGRLRTTGRLPDSRLLLARTDVQPTLRDTSA